MGRPHYERLSALDASFLALEAPNAHMQVAVTAILDPGPLGGTDGGVDIERVRHHLAGALDAIPRYRQRLMVEPLLGHPVWVDDAAFHLGYHLRHAALPRPGSLRQLKRLVGQVVSQQLDRSKPLWEVWVVEGLEGGRLAVITKVHHSMVDGIAGVDMLKVLLSPSPEAAPEREPRSWRPRQPPTPAQLLAGELRRRVQLGRSAVGGIAASLLHPRRAAGVVTEAGGGLLELVRKGYRPASPTPLNPRAIGPHRHFDWLRLDLERVRAVKRSLGGTVNDVALATVSGAVRRYLRRHGVRPGGLDFRAMIPVSTRLPGEGGTGNQVASLLARLPIGERDPVRRLRRVRETTAALKTSHQIRGVKLIEDAADWTETALITGMVRLALRRRAGNLVVTNVPGPTFPLYLGGAQLLECYPLVPLLANQALGIALFSYAGGLHWGFNADRYTIRDLHDLVDDTAAAFEELEKAAG